MTTLKGVMTVLVKGIYDYKLKGVMTVQVEGIYDCTFEGSYD